MSPLIPALFLQRTPRLQAASSRENVHMPVGQCGSQMGDVELFDLEPGVIGAVRDLEPGVIGAVHASPLGEFFRLGNLLNQNAGAGNTCPRPTAKRQGTNSAESTRSAAAFVVNSEPRTGARPSVRVCVRPELARCAYYDPFTPALDEHPH
jgi:hypothetical protein